MDVEHDLIVSFPDQSETFTLGVEAGMFWQRLQHGEREFSTTAHTANLECLRRMAAACNYAMEVVGTHIDGWHECRVSGTPKPQLRIVRGGLADA